VKLIRSSSLPPPLIYAVPILLLPVLCLFFVLPGYSTLLQPGIAVTVPQSPFVLAPQRDPVVIAVPPPPSGTYFLDGVETGLTGLEQGLSSLRGQARSVVIRADRGAVYDRVAAAMGLALEAGLPVVLATSEAPPP
jgi:biopolymer transport protein ExbD